jgi:16S rRNA (guanine1516-N2)-methyltransferase
MMAHHAQLAVAADTGDAALQQRSAELAARLGLPLWSPQWQTGQIDAVLTVTDDRLELRILRGDGDFRGGKAVAADLLKLDIRSNFGRSLRQPLGRALGLGRGGDHRPRVFDATAGWGEDTWLMAALGCEVVAAERSAVVVAMLLDALDRASHVHPQVRSRIEVVTGEAAGLLEAMASAAAARLAPVEVVYLDPMFPAGRKTAERKAMKALRLLVGSDEDADALLPAALAATRRRVVVKRPLHAPPLAGQPPTVVHKGKAVRFDVYVKLQDRPLPARRH